MSFLAILLIVSVVALFVMKYSTSIMKGRMNDGMIIITMPAAAYKTNNHQLFELLQKKIHRGRVDSIMDNEDNMVISYSFAQTDPRVLTELQNNLEKLVSTARANIFFNRQGEV
jgi:hypothetical protein